MKIVDKVMEFLGFEKVTEVGANRSSRTRWRRRPGTAKSQSVNNERIEYVLNDMSTPQLVKMVNTPQPPAAPKFAVKDFAGGGYPRGSVQSQAANCAVTISNVLNFHTNFTDKPVHKWSGTPLLAVFPRAGQDLNAYYDRRTLSFFYFGHKAIGGTVFAADSADIVSHELGHAILDAYRPDTWAAASLEVWAFHEAFGDLTAMINLMSHREMLLYAINQTGGDMRKPNVISNLAEDFGRAIFKLTGPASGRNPAYLRSAINDFKYVNPGTLPEEAPDNKLAAECHSFSRIFTGAFYDILVMIYEDIRSKGNLGPVDSLAQARNWLWKYVLKAIQNAPMNVKFFESVAKTMLWADVTLNNKTYHDRMMEIFMNRNMMTPQFRILSAPTCDNDNAIMTTQSKMTLKLGDHLLRAQSNNPLYDVEIEIPQDSVFLYDNNKQLIDAISCSDEDALSGAQDMITYLHSARLVDDTDKTPFAVQEGKLVRTHFACKCCR